MVEAYAGLDVSDKMTHVCVTDGSGVVAWAGACATDPEVIARTLKSRAPGLARVVLETGPLSAFLYHGLADPVAARLMTVPGVGPITALVFKTSIEDPGRFARGEDAGAFAGLAPRRSQSGERDTRGRISKAGDPMLRSALYESANSLLARVKRPCALQTWGKQLAVNWRSTLRGFVAVARKLAILLHRLYVRRLSSAAA